MSGDDILHAQARKLIAAGAVPNRLPERRWGGPGTGSPCMVCGAFVRQDEVGMEIELTRPDGSGTTNQNFHIACFSALELELDKLELARRTSSASPETQSLAAASTADRRQRSA